MRLASHIPPLVALVAQLGAAPVRFHVRHEDSTIAVKTDKAGLLSAFAGHRHGIIARQFTARVCADPGTFEAASVNVAIPVSSLRIDSPEGRRAAGLSDSGPDAKDIPTIQQKMLSPANLAASEHPEIRFDSSSVTRTAGGLSVSGTLAIRGRTRPVTVPIRIEPSGTVYRFRGSFDIALRDYGITPESIAGVVKVGDRVTVLLDLVARPGDDSCN